MKFLRVGSNPITEDEIKSFVLRDMVLKVLLNHIFNVKEIVKEELKNQVAARIDMEWDINFSEEKKKFRKYCRNAIKRGRKQK